MCVAQITHVSRTTFHCCVGARVGELNRQHKTIAYTKVQFPMLCARGSQLRAAAGTCTNFTSWCRTHKEIESTGDFTMRMPINCEGEQLRRQQEAPPAAVIHSKMLSSDDESEF